MNFKSLSNKTTWTSEEETKNGIPDTIVMANDVCCDPTITYNHHSMEDENKSSEYDIPKKKESLELLVQNLTKIVEKLKEQIKDLTQ